MIALYDEEEIMERYVANRVEREVEQAVEKAVEEAVEKTAVRSVVETCQELGLSNTDTIERIKQKFNLLQTEAEEKVKKYWK